MKHQITLISGDGIGHKVTGARPVCLDTQDINQIVRTVKAIASIVTPKDLQPEYIIPSVFNRDIVKMVASAVGKATKKTEIVLLRHCELQKTKL